MMQRYNAADYLLQNNLTKGHADRIAVIDESGEHSYRQVNEGVNRFANVLEKLGLQQEQRILLCLLDSVDFVFCFLGAIRAGVVPVPVNTMLTPEDYNYLLHDSRARLLVVSESLAALLQNAARDQPFLRHTLVSGGQGARVDSLAQLMAEVSDQFVTAPTRPDDVACWFYTSGTTGKPKGVMHLQTHLQATSDCYARPVLNITARDRVFSAAKLFFAYGLGNALTFPFAVGATTVLMPQKATDDAVKRTLDERHPTLFFGVPTLYAMMLNHNQLPQATGSKLRLCISAGEALPTAIQTRWKDATGLDILDGIGSTELLHIFISNRPADIKPGTSGTLVDVYAARILDESMNEVADGEIGDLYIKGPTVAAGYWNLKHRTRDNFQGHWIKTGDKYIRTLEGYYQNAGRADDLLKVGGIYVSPMEVENVLLSHPAVLEAAVVGAPDHDNLIKPKAFVVTAERGNGKKAKALETLLISYVQEKLAHYKRPRWVEFIDQLPKTATGKIQRYKLRQSSD